MILIWSANDNESLILNQFSLLIWTELKQNWPTEWCQFVKVEN